MEGRGLAGDGGFRCLVGWVACKVSGLEQMAAGPHSSIWSPEVRKISKEDRGEATETGRKLGVGCLGAEEERAAVPRAQRSGRKTPRNGPRVRARYGGHHVTWGTAVSAACGVNSAWKWLGGESGGEVGVIESGLFFRVFSRRKMGPSWEGKLGPREGTFYGWTGTIPWEGEGR